MSTTAEILTLDEASRKGQGRAGDGVRRVDDGTTAVGPYNRAIFARVENVLFGWTDGARAFWACVVDADPMVSTVQQVAHALGVHPATLASRFERAGVVRAHSTIVGVRLVKCAYLAQQRGATISGVSRAMRYSSPQTFSRHVRVLTGMTAAAFFSQYDGEAALERFIAQEVAPHRQAWRRFDPLARGSQWRTRASALAFDRGVVAMRGAA